MTKINSKSLLDINKHHKQRRNFAANRKTQRIQNTVVNYVIKSYHTQKTKESKLI